MLKNILKIVGVVLSVIAGAGLLNLLMKSNGRVAESRPLDRSVTPGNDAKQTRATQGRRLEEQQLARFEPSLEKNPAARNAPSTSTGTRQGRANVTPKKAAPGVTLASTSKTPRSAVKSPVKKVVRKPAKKVVKKPAQKPAASLYPCCVHRSINRTPCAECNAAQQTPSTQQTERPCSNHFVTDSGMCQNCFRS